MKKTPVLAMAGLLIAACSTTDNPAEQYAQMTCLQLAEEIGHQKANSKNAGDEETLSNVDLILADDAGEVTMSAFESVVYERRGKQAKRRLYLAQERFFERGCGSRD